VSGPSAGLAFTLAIIDDLTPGDLTGGKRVAITGTISPDGTVGPVGGVAQKAVAARSAGAKLMLVPPQEYDDAKSHADGMTVVRVSTLDDALRALRNNGGDPVVPPTATTAPIAGPNGPSQ
jgi:PDZ domain-containing protein